MGQRGDEFRINGEVVILHVTSSARSPITAKLFIQKNMPALRDELRKMSFSRQRRCGDRNRDLPLLRL
jgi:hypothetical protein